MWKRLKFLCIAEAIKHLLGNREIVIVKEFTYLGSILNGD